MINLKLPLVLVISATLLIGCTSDEDSQNEIEENKSNPKQETSERNDESTNDSINDITSEESFLESVSFLEDIPSTPGTAKELINQAEGEFAIHSSEWGDEKYSELAKETEKLKPLPKDASEKELDLYYNYIYSLVAEDFPDPQETIKKWEFGSFGDPDLPDSRYHFKENYNIEVLLDASGSMGAYIGEQTMMQIAKESINNFMKQVPEEANVSFRVYGHKGTGDSSDKEMSCSAIEQVYGYATYDEDKFQKELDKIEPAGWTHWQTL
ncbi:uncharacterized protein JNUCC1_03062 [Lentibacillus sp. JNUCC-1]|uniref:hypothetical protein n=1 Tax=Lentibacillus sp. JNUCC-1 TaxID=2654513 RepID=UPI0012E8C709|nr:hypothetical protein [Lentibacillus sp. JNUCC-1]MUV39189.1 uncharacterized protein [Lentibacillus sp. JNUCC-1]